MSNLWLLPRPLILASKSAARRALLAASGIPFEAIDAGIHERTVEQPLRAQGADGAAVAVVLAREKALAVSDRHPDRLVLGADQTLSLGDRLLTKPPDMVSARAQIRSMAGRTHTLHDALCLARDGEVVAEAGADARLVCRAFSDAFIDNYLDLAGENVLQSVGCYAVEGLGIHLFERIEGEHSTMIGLPMLDLLRLLRQIEALAS